MWLNRRPWLVALCTAVGVTSIVWIGRTLTGSDEATSGTGGAFFTEVAAASGLDVRQGAFRWSITGDPIAMMGTGVCWIDYDRDGWLDLYVVNAWSDGEWGRWQDAGGLPASTLYRNDRGRFTEVGATTGAALEVVGTGCVAADLDLDGWTDLYVTTARHNVLLWNEGGERFLDGSTASGTDAYGWHSGAAVGDLDGDGWPDLVVAGYADLNGPVPDATKPFPNTYVGVRDLVFRNHGSDRPGDRPIFEEVGTEAGLEQDSPEYGLGAALADFDLDGDLDVFIANDTNPNRLYENVSRPRGSPRTAGLQLREVAKTAGVADDNSGMGVATGDIDADGRPDVAVTNAGSQLHAIHLNTSASSGALRFDDGRAGFGPATLGIGLTGWGATWADLDLDTDVDLVVANGAIPVVDTVADRQELQLLDNLTAQGSPGSFVDRSAGTGLDRVGPLLGRGLAAADYDNDGDIDLAVSSVAGDLALLRNSGGAGHWLGVTVEPPTPGTVVTVELDDGTQLVKELRAGGSYLSSEDPRAHFGLGPNEAVAEVRVRWPDERTAIRGPVHADRFVTLRAPSG